MLPIGFTGTWNLLLPSAGQLRTGWDHPLKIWASADVQWMAFWCQRTKKLHSQITVSLHFEYAEACPGCTCTEHQFPHLFPASNHLSQPKTTCLSLKYLNPLTFGEMDLIVVLLSPHLAVLWINSFWAVKLSISVFGCVLGKWTGFSNKFCANLLQQSK